MFEGNVDSYSVKHSYLDDPIIARFIKFHIIHWNQHPSMRVELIGCEGNAGSRGVGVVTDCTVCHVTHSVNPSHVIRLH